MFMSVFGGEGGRWGGGMGWVGLGLERKKKKKRRKIRPCRLRYNKIIITRFLVRTQIAR